ncbi:MAG TPA: sulfatase [Myxococcota bacterium]|nr:sulfatase [Myxococcota bacterium]
MPEDSPIVSPPSRLAVGFASAALAALGAGAAEAVWLWVGAPVHVSVGDGLLLGAAAVALTALAALPAVPLFEALAALHRADGAPGSWLRAARAAARADDGAALSIGAGLLASAPALVAALALLRPAYAAVLGFADKQLAATAGALLGLAYAAAALAFWLPLFAALRLAGRRLRRAADGAGTPRRRAAARAGVWLLRPAGAAAVLATAAVAAALLAAFSYEDVLRALHPDRWALAAVPGAVFLLARPLLPRHPRAAVVLRRARWYGTLALVCALGGGAAAVTLSPPALTSRLRALRERWAPLGGGGFFLLAAALDADRDGHPRWIGGDCADLDPRIHPGALDVPGDGVDQDCFEGDLMAAALPALPGPPAPRPAALAHVRNVVVVTIDALRADHLGAYGFTTHPASPAIDRLAAESIVFERAYAAAPATRRSVQALLSGLYPRSVLWGKGHPHTAVKDENVSLAERLVPHGVWAAAFYGGNYMTRARGYFQGFDLWDMKRTDAYSAAAARTAAVRAGATAAGAAGPSATARDDVADGGDADGEGARAALDEGGESGEGEAGITATRLTDALMREISRRAAGPAPFFAWVHYTEPHNPYAAHKEFASFGRSPHDRYCQEIAAVDREVGRLVAALRAGPAGATTAVFVSADHGEAFGEHGVNGHFWDLYEEEVRVPLVAYVPRVTPRRVDGLVSLVDVAPTVAALMGVPWAGKVHGESLLPYILGAPVPADRAVFMDVAERAYWPSFRAAVVRGTHKLIVNVAGGTYELYDLATDPRERVNMFDERDPVSIEMRRLLGGWRAATDDPRNPTEAK